MNIFDRHAEKIVYFGGNKPTWIKHKFQLHCHGWFGRKGLGIEFWKEYWSEDWPVNFDEYTVCFLTPFGDYRINLRVRHDKNRDNQSLDQDV